MSGSQAMNTATTAATFAGLVAAAYLVTVDGVTVLQQVTGGEVQVFIPPGRHVVSLAPFLTPTTTPSRTPTPTAASAPPEIKPTPTRTPTQTLGTWWRRKK